MDLLNALKANLTAALRSFGHTRHRMEQSFSDADTPKRDPRFPFLRCSTTGAIVQISRWPPEAWPRCATLGFRRSGWGWVRLLTHIPEEWWILIFDKFFGRETSKNDKEMKSKIHFHLFIFFFFVRKVLFRSYYIFFFFCIIKV